MKKLTNVFVVDRSGSMESKAEEVRSGLKQALQEIKNDAIRDIPIATVGTILTQFSSHNDFEVTLNTNDSTSLDPEVASSYKTRGMTALYDAIHNTFALVPEGQNGVFVTIFTDGGENDSKEIAHKALKELIEQKKAKNWVITFMGTSEADINNAVDLGISRGNTMSFANNARGVKGSMSKMSSMRATYTNASFTPGIYAQSVDLENLVAEDDKYQSVTKDVTDKTAELLKKKDKDDNGKTNTSL